MSKLYATGINAEKKFLLSTLGPALAPVVTIVLLMFFVGSMGVYTLVVGTLTGVFLELVVLLWACSKTRIPLMPRWYGFTKEVKTVVSQYIPLIGGAFLMGGTLLVDQAMAASLESGSVATLSYASKLITMFLSISAVVIGTAVFPHFAEMVANQGWNSIHRTLKTYTLFILLLCLPLTAIIFVFSNQITSLVLVRGEFTESNAAEVGFVMRMFSLQIPFYVLGILLVRLLASLGLNHILLWSALISLPVNIVLNYILMQRMGVAGIALSTSIVYAISLYFLWLKAKQSLQAKRLLDTVLIVKEETHD